MKINLMQLLMKTIVASFFLISVAGNTMAVPGSWSSWFTIEQIGNTFSSDGLPVDYGAMKIIPKTPHTMHNPANTCVTNDGYDMFYLHVGHFGANSISPIIIEHMKLVTLAFTAGYQIRVFISDASCSVRNQPMVYGVEIKK